MNVMEIQRRLIFAAVPIITRDLTPRFKEYMTGVILGSSGVSADVFSSMGVALEEIEFPEDQIEGMVELFVEGLKAGVKSSSRSMVLFFELAEDLVGEEHHATISLLRESFVGAHQQFLYNVENIDKGELLIAVKGCGLRLV